jgi:hypothetical protein
MGRFLPPDHEKGDENTIGGYMAVHARPAAFEGRDGASYSVDIQADETGVADEPWGAFLLFVRWTPGEPRPAGHLESGFLARGASEAAVRERVGALPLAEVKRILDELVTSAPSTERRWWEVMDDDPPERP